MNLKKTVGSLVLSLAAASFAGVQEVDDLPYGCEQLEYVESTGTQYIDTGVTPNAKTTYSLSFAFTGDIATDSVFLMGSRKAFRDRAFYVSHQKVSEAEGYGAGFAFARGDATVYTGNHDPARHEVSLASQGELTFDGASAGTLESDAVGNDYPVYLFALNNAGAVKDGAKMRLYSCDIVQDGTPVRSFVPVRHLGVPGLYDRVGKRFFTPPLKVDALIAGPELVKRPVRKLPVGYTQREYVSSHGGELLNTEIVPDDQTEMHVRLRPHDDSDVHMVGSRKAFGAGGRMFGLSNNGGFRMCFGSANNDFGMKHLNEMVEIAFCSKRFFVYGKKYGDFSSEGSFVGAGPMYVFTLNNDGSPHAQYATIDLAELLILTNGVPARDFVAAMNVQEKPGLYDFVTERFFTCSQGTLTAGPEVVIDTSETLEPSDERYENGVLSMTVTRKSEILGAAEVTLAYGAEEGGDTAEDWEGSCVAGAFAAGEETAELAASGVPDSARYVRLFTADGSSSAFAIDTLVGRYVSPALPTAYRAVEYIRSGKTSYGYIIDTGYVHKRDTRIECIADVEKNSPTEYTALFGARVGGAWTFGGYAFFIRDNSQYVPRYSRSGDKVLGAEGAFPYGAKVKIVTQGDKAEWYSDSTGEKLGELTTAAKIDDGLNTMAIFDLNDFNGSGFKDSGSTAVMKLYSFRMIDDGRISRDFIPCLNEYGEPGLYEAITGEFHGNRASVDYDFRTDLPTTEATYTWTGAGASANWTDAANWSCSNPEAATVPGWSSTVVFPTGTWTVNLDCKMAVKELDLSAADVALKLSSTDPSERLVVRHNLTFGAVSDPARQGIWISSGGVKVTGDNVYGLVAASDATELPLHFVVPEGGYAATPFVIDSNVNFRNSVRGRVYVEARSPALKVDATTTTTLITSSYVMTQSNVTLEPMPKRNPEKDSSFTWNSQNKLSATLEGHAQRGLKILVY